MVSRLLGFLREDSRYTCRELSVMLQVDEAVVRDEIRRLEASGVILKYTVLVDEERAGSDEVEALIEVKVSPQHTKGFDSLAEEISSFDNVSSVYLMSGAYDLAVFIKGKTLREAALFVSEKLAVMDNVLSTATHFILKKYKMEGVRAASHETRRLAVSP